MQRDEQAVIWRVVVVDASGGALTDAHTEFARSVCKAKNIPYILIAMNKCDFAGEIAVPADTEHMRYVSAKLPATGIYASQRTPSAHLVHRSGDNGRRHYWLICYEPNDFVGARRAH